MGAPPFVADRAEDTVSQVGSIAGAARLVNDNAGDRRGDKEKAA